MNDADLVWECRSLQEALRLFGGRGPGHIRPSDIVIYWTHRPIEYQMRDMSL